MKKDSKDIYEEYTGSQHVSHSDFDTLRLGNPNLVDLIFQFGYEKIIADPILSYEQKAIINTVIMAVLNNCSVALKFHEKALKHHSSDQSSVISDCRNLAKTISTAKNTRDIRKHEDIFYSKENFYLATLAGLAAKGDEASNLLNCFAQMAQKQSVKIEKIMASFNCVAIYAGIPVAAVATSSVLKAYIPE